MEWISVDETCPPSFYDVWVMNGKAKRKAYFDRPNKRWIRSNDDDPWDNSSLLKKVTHWAEIENYSIRDQIKEFLQTKFSPEEFEECSHELLKKFAKLPLKFERNKT